MTDSGNRTGAAAARSPLIEAIQQAFKEHGWHLAIIRDSSLWINGDQIPLERFVEDFDKAVALCGVLLAEPTARATSPPYVNFGPTIPERRGRHKYGLHPWETHS